MKQTHKLEKTLLNYFFLIAIAAMMIGVEFYFEMSKPGLKQEICENPTVISEVIKPASEDESAALSNLRNKIVVMFGVLTMVMAIVMMMFVKNITRPLQRTLDTAVLINDGDLSQVIKIETHDEVGQLGIVINELTSNIQEVASLTLGMTNTIEARIDALSKTLADDATDSTEQINLIKHELDSLRAFVDSFNLLETDMKE
ncbi:MAG: HAMP domain-containing protein [Gammaproteobacteria bacterium]|nr:HAMP domain-containing protein [Gammaproteobacteria bacterium]